MVSIEFLDLSIMVMRDNYDVWQETPKVKADMEVVFHKSYNEEKVKQAIDTIINEHYGNIIEIPDDYEYERVC